MQSFLFVPVARFVEVNRILWSSGRGLR